ncbi:MAG: integral membrane sensor signal transduction histidine kinase [uncultured bacterium]|nr:MAG: integral membrane sensor signal transduction histidine kinase [uncultured bacterium]
MLKELKLTQKIFFIVIIMLFLVLNSWAFTLTTVLDFRDSFSNIRQYSLPSVVTTSKLKDHVHIALLAVYNYIATGNENSKTAYQTEFTAAIQNEYELFQLSKTATDFAFTQQFNDKLLAIYSAADELVQLYENNPNDPAVKQKLTELNTLRDSFNAFLQTEITAQISTQVDEANTSITDTVQLIEYYLIGVGILVILIVIFAIRFISNNITKPVGVLTEAAQLFGKGRFKKINIERRDELGLFAQTFNSMATNIQASQTALQEELTKTKELDRQKSEFLSIAAHQLRTPMSGIRWAAQMIYDGDMGKLNEEQKHHLGNALENMSRMVGLINDLLDVTKIEEQKFNYKFEKHNLVSIVREQIAELTTLAKENNITVELTTVPTDDITLLVDKEKISLAMNNLIDNAIKYSHKDGKVEIHLAAAATGICGYVRDHGLGIPKKLQTEVFTKFFRGSNILKVVTEGSGLGLFLVKDIIVKHDGNITFKSEENVGTTFNFTLPYEQKTQTNPISIAPQLITENETEPI